MSLFEHIRCGYEEEIGLVLRCYERKIGVKSHTCSVRCGTVRQVSSDRPHARSYFAHMKIDKEFKIIATQIRSIMYGLVKSVIHKFYGGQVSAG